MDSAPLNLIDFRVNHSQAYSLIRLEAIGVWGGAVLGRAKEKLWNCRDAGKRVRRKYDLNSSRSASARTADMLPLGETPTRTSD